MTNVHGFEEDDEEGEIDEKERMNKIDEMNNLIILGLMQPTKNHQRRDCLIYPDSMGKIHYDLFISTILLITCITTPISLAFPFIEEEKSWYRVANYIMDGFFLIDIFVNFNTVIQNEYLQLIENRTKIAKAYLSGWFIVDLVAILPFEWIISSNSTGGQANSLIRVTRIGKLYKLVKITRLMRLVRLLKLIKTKGKVFDRLNDMFKIGEGVERLIFVLMVFIMICHFMACFWIFTAELAEDDSGDNWIIQAEQSMSPGAIYLTSLYFTVTTITTVGYGDISGTNNMERGICILLMIMGVVFFSISSGTLTSIIANYEDVSQKL
jgi:hypothetical protein